MYSRYEIKCTVEDLIEFQQGTVEELIEFKMFFIYNSETQSNPPKPGRGAIG